MTKRILVPAVLATLLLTACDPGGSAAESGKETVGTSTVSTKADDLQPVDCGHVDVSAGVTHTVIADPADDGLVGCTEAFNVVDSYLAIPASERGAALEGIAVSDGWSCTTDDGETASIGCVKGKTADGYGFAFHTDPV